MTFRMPRTAMRAGAFGLVARAAQKLSGSEITAPIAVAMTAICRVSMSGGSVRGKKLQSGISSLMILSAPFCQLRAIAERSTPMPIPGRHMTTVMATTASRITGPRHAPGGRRGISSGAGVASVTCRADRPR